MLKPSPLASCLQTLWDLWEIALSIIEQAPITMQSTREVETEYHHGRMGLENKWHRWIT